MRYISAIILFIIVFSNTSFSQLKNSDLKFHIPAKGKIASMYGWRTQKNNIGIKERKFHRGADIAGKYSEAIYASESGKVVFVGWNGGYGRYIEIKHNERYSTCYCHLKKFLVSKGDSVLLGDKIGEMGNSGTTFSTIGGKGVHLHFEVRDKTKIKWNNPKGTINPLRNLKNYNHLSKYDIVEFQYRPVLMDKINAQIMTSQISENKILSNRTCKTIEKSEIININTKPALSLLKLKEIGLIPIKVNRKNLIVREVIYAPVYKKRNNIKNSFYSIQIAASSLKLSEIEIRVLEKKYQLSGIQWSRVEINGKTWYKYTTGIFDNLEEANIYKNKLYGNNKIKNAAICYFLDNKLIKTYW